MWTAIDIIFIKGQINIFNANINVNKYSFDLRKIKPVEMKCIL